MGPLEAQRIRKRNASNTSLIHFTTSDVHSDRPFSKYNKPSPPSTIVPRMLVENGRWLEVLPRVQLY